MDENTLHEILNEVDLNKNGQVELNEFLQVSRGERKQVYLLFIYWSIYIQEWILKSPQLSPHSEKEESLKPAKVDMSALKDKALRGACSFAFYKTRSVALGNLD